MSEWTDAYMEVTARARQFALCWDEANYRGLDRDWSWSCKVVWRHNLAKAKARLELTLATYRVELRKGLTR